MRIDARSDRGSAERQLLELGGSPRYAFDALRDLGGIPPKFLAEANRGRVHEMRSARLHDTVELFGLRGERGPQVLEPGK